MGAGLASTISISIGILVLVLYFLKLEKYVSFQRALWKAEFAIWKRLIFIPLAVAAARRDTFQLHHIWYVSVVSVLIQAVFSFMLMQRELRLKLPQAVIPATA